MEEIETNEFLTSKFGDLELNESLRNYKPEYEPTTLEEIDDCSYVLPQPDKGKKRSTLNPDKDIIDLQKIDLSKSSANPTRGSKTYK